MTTIVSVLAMSGGAGATTVTAQLGGLWLQNGRKSLVMDLVPDNNLGLFYGMSMQHKDGFVSRELSKDLASLAICQSLAGVKYIPFGTVSFVDNQKFERSLQLHPTWFKESLNSLVNRELGWVFLRFRQRQYSSTKASA